MFKNLFLIFLEKGIGFMENLPFIKQFEKGLSRGCIGYVIKNSTILSEI